MAPIGNEERIEQAKNMQKKFEEAARPLIKWMAENMHPHATVILTSTGAELVEGVCSTGPILDYLTD